MASATEFLTDLERARLLDAARAWRAVPAGDGRDPHRWAPDLDVAHVLDLVLLTGIQPGVLADPTRHRLRIELVDAEPYLRFNRTKKTGVRADTTFPILQEDLGWVAPTVQQLLDHPHSVRHWHRIVAEIGKAAGIPGVAFYSLRHTAIELGARRGLSLPEICSRYNVSVRVAVRYMHGPSVDRDRRFRENLREERRRNGG